MNRNITIPMTSGNMTLRWDASLFTAVVPQTDNTALLIYAGQQFNIAISADAFAKVIDDTTGDIARINALEVKFSSMLLIGQSFSHLDSRVFGTNKREQLLCLSWDTNVHYNGKESVDCMRFNTELSFHVVQTYDEHVTTLTRRFQFDHTENMYSGSHITVSRNMWRELYKHLWGAELNTLKKREAQVDADWQNEYDADEELHSTCVPCLEYDSMVLPVDHRVIVTNTLYSVPLQIALQRVAGKIALQDNITLEQRRLDNAMKLERYRLEFQDEYAKRKLEAEMRENQAYVNGERATAYAKQHFSERK